MGIVAALVAMTGALSPGVVCSAQPTALSAPQAAPTARTAAPIRVLLDRDLKETPARVIRIDRTAVWFVGPTDPPSTPVRSRPVLDLVAILSADPPRPARQSSSDERPRLVISLADGQRLVGRLPRPDKRPAGDPAPVNPGAAKDAPLVIDTGGGTFRIPIDRLSTVGVGAAASASPVPPKSDTVILTNGDRIEGFVESIGAEIAVQPEGARTTTVPIDRVREIILANPRTPAAGARAWLADGSVLAVSELTQGDDGVPVARVALRDSEAPSAAFPSLAAVVFDSSRLTGLAHLTPTQTRPSSDRRWTRPPRALPGPAPLDAQDLELPGPMTVEWTLPAGARRLGGAAELAPFAESWSECTLSIDLVTGVTPKRLWSQSLSAGGSPMPFSVDLGAPAPGRTLRLTLESGERGPIQDRVILRRPLLLLDAASR